MVVSLVNNLQIEVIEHPDANQKAEEVAVGDGSDYMQSDPNIQSTPVEPDHRQGTVGDQYPQQPEGEGEGEYTIEEYEEDEEENEKEFADSMDDNVRKQSMQSFGQDSGRNKKRNRNEEDKQPHNSNNGKIEAHHMNEFMQKSREKDFSSKPRNMEINEDQNLESQEIDNEDKPELTDGMDDALQDEEMILRQQQEAEALLEETK